MHLSTSAVDRIVGRLEGRGLVVRTRSSNDHRIVKVALTHAGMKLAGRIPAIPQGLLLKGLSEIPPDRLRAVSEVLESLVRILGARELTPRLFFAPVANLPAGDSVDWQRMEQPIPGADKILGRAGADAEDRLERLEDDIGNLRKRMAMPVGDIRDGIDQEIRDLLVKAELVGKRIRAVETDGASDWGRLKNAVEEELKEMGKAVDETVERYRKTGAGDRYTALRSILPYVCSIPAGACKWVPQNGKRGSPSGRRPASLLEKHDRGPNRPQTPCKPRSS